MKEFPGIKANDNVTLQVEQGEIHALLGENGAGNINDFTGEKDIDGALVGGASLKPEELISIYQKAWEIIFIKGTDERV